MTHDCLSSFYQPWYGFRHLSSMLTVAFHNLFFFLTQILVAQIREKTAQEGYKCQITNGVGGIFLSWSSLFLSYSHKLFKVIVPQWQCCVAQKNAAISVNY